MKRKAEKSVSDGSKSDCKKDKRKHSFKKKKRSSTGSLRAASSLSSLGGSIMSCDSVLSDEKKPDNMIELSITVGGTCPLNPPPITPRSSSISRNTSFFKNKKPRLSTSSILNNITLNTLPLNNSLMNIKEENQDTPTNSPLPPPPPAALLGDNTAALPLPPPLAGRDYTVSVALPGSICDNAQSPALRTYLAGQVARALAIYNVDEVVIFNDNPGVKVKGSVFESATKRTNANIVLARILQYLETPQYLRKALFSHHPDLKFAGLLNPLDCPHHMRAHERYPFREGVVVKRPTKKGRGSFVDCGIDKDVQIDKELEPGTRLTVRMDPETYTKANKYYRGTAVSPDTPRRELGAYWGYRVRLAESLSSAFTECSYKEGYDLTIGTSDTGDCVDNVNIRHFKHLIVFLGGLQGLEPVIDSDETLKETEPRTLFDYYLNVCPNQGSRTIRTEEALMIAMSSLRKQITDNGMT